MGLPTCRNRYNSATQIYSPTTMPRRCFFAHYLFKVFGIHAVEMVAKIQRLRGSVMNIHNWSFLTFNNATVFMDNNISNVYHVAYLQGEVVSPSCLCRCLNNSNWMKCIYIYTIICRLQNLYDVICIYFFLSIYIYIHMYLDKTIHVIMFYDVSYLLDVYMHMYVLYVLLSYRL